MPSKYPPHGRNSRPLVCRDCGAKRLDGTWISKRGLCAPCGEARVVSHAQQMHDQAGPVWDAWKAGMAEYVRELDAANG